MIPVNLHLQLGGAPAAVNSPSVCQAGEVLGRWLPPSSVFASINVSFQGSVFLTLLNWEHQGPGTVFMNPELREEAFTTKLTH